MVMSLRRPLLLVAPDNRIAAVACLDLGLDVHLATPWFGVNEIGVSRALLVAPDNQSSHLAHKPSFSVPSRFGIDSVRCASPLSESIKTRCEPPAVRTVFKRLSRIRL